MKDYIKKYILFDTVIFAIVFVLVSFLLKLLALRFRFFVYQAVAAVVIIGVIAGIIQEICRIQDKAIKRFSAIFFTVVFIFCMVGAALPLMFLFLMQSEKTAYIDGVKYSAHKDEFLDRYIYYYDYKNFLISGNKLRIEDDSPGCTVGFTRFIYDDNGEVVETIEN